MKRFKGVVAILLGIGLALFAAACSSKDGGTNGDMAGAVSSNAAGASASASASGSAKEPEKDVKLRIAWWGSQSRHDATIRALDAYTEKHPKITFEPEYAGFDAYFDKLATVAAARNAPDVIQMDIAYLKQYVENGQLLELTGVDTSHINPGLLESGMLDGKLYAIPLGDNVKGMAYNKVMVDKIGIKPPSDGWTWEDYFQFGRDAKAKLGADVYPLVDSTNSNSLYNMYQVSHGKGDVVSSDGHFNLDRDTFLEFQSTFVQLRKEGVVPPAELSVTHKKFDPQNDLMAKGVMLIQDIYAAQATSVDSMNPGNFALVTIPKGVQKGGWITPSMFWSISANSEHAEQGQQFIDWFVNDLDAGKILGTSRGIPVSSVVLDGLLPDMKDADKMALDLLEVGSVDAPLIPTNPGRWNGWLEKDYVTVTEKLMFGKTTPEEAYDELVKLAKQYQ